MRESSIYKALRAYNDAKAISKGKVVRRVERRVYGKLSGRLARRLFK
jgi:hypothetical protein